MKKLIIFTFIFILIFSAFSSASFFEFVTGNVAKERYKFVNIFKQNYCGDGKCNFREKFLGSCPRDCINVEATFPCGRDEDCPNPLPYCWDGFCQEHNSCNQNLDCPPNKPFCFQNQCYDAQMECFVDEDCSEDEFCANNLCEPYECDSFGFDYDCPLESPFCDEGICKSCLDPDGDDTSEDNAFGIYNEILGKVQSLYDRCAAAAYFDSGVTEYLCDSPGPFAYFDEECLQGEYCALGACRTQCQDDGDCQNNEVCLRGYCLNNFYDFFQWMENNNYDEEFIDLYKEGITNHEEWLISWWNRYLIKKKSLNPNNLIKKFREEDHMDLTIYFIVDTDSTEDQPLWSEDVILSFQNRLNYIFGRDPENPFFFVNTELIEVDLDTIFACDDCSVSMEYFDETQSIIFINSYMPDGDEDLYQEIEYNSIKTYSGPGMAYFISGEDYFNNTLSPNEYGHYLCNSQGADIYMMASLLEGDSWIRFSGEGCSGNDECNVFCSGIVSNSSQKLYHELGHTFGFLHPYDEEGQVLIPDSVMCQTDVNGILGMVDLFSPIEYYFIEPENGFENLQEVVDDYNQNAVIREFQLIDEEDY